MQEDEALAGSAEPIEAEPAAEAPAEEAPKVEAPQAEAQEEQKAEGEAEAKLEEAAPAEDERVKRRKASAKERVINATRRAQAAEAERDAALASEQRANDRVAKLEAGQTPREVDFDTTEEYTAALTAHQVKQFSKDERSADADEARATAERKGLEADEARIAAFYERQDEFAADVPDYAEAVNNPALPTSDLLKDELLSSERGPAVSYYLAKNAGEARRIASLTDPRAVARAIGSIEGRLTAPMPRKETSAPAPVGAVASGSGSQKAFDHGNASFNEVKDRLKAKGVIQ